jgi:hypothetical protein
MPEPLLLLGAGSATAGGEFHLARIAAAHPVVLVDDAAPAWARPYLVKHIAADLAHGPAVADAVEGHVSRHDVRGVLSSVPEHLVTASRIAGQWGFPAASAESVAVLNDLVALRGLLARHNLSQPRLSATADAATAAAYADALGYPVLIRSRAGAILARDRDQVRGACDRLSRRSPAGAPGAGEVVVEEYLDGPAISAETVVLPDGDIRTVAVTRTTFGSAGSQEATRHSVYAHDGFLHNPVVRQTVQRVVRALGITLGVLHIGMKLTSLGPRITDVQAHTAGDLIPLLVKRATGIDLPCVSAALAVGRTPDLTPSRQRAAAIHFAYPSASGRIEHLDIAPEAARQPLLERVALLQQAGNDVLALPEAGPNDRLAYWVALGPDAQHCHTTLDAMAQHLSVGIAAAAFSGQAA